jgi:hypothetical protein
VRSTFLLLLLGCDGLAGDWSGTVLCVGDVDGEDLTAELDMSWTLGPRSRWSTEGNGSLRGDFQVDVGADRVDASWDQLFTLVVEQTAFGGPQDLKVVWTDVSCAAEVDGESDDADCELDDDEVAGFRWTDLHQISIATSGCAGAIFR